MMCSALFTLSLTLHPNLNKSQWNTPEVLLHPFSPCRQHDPASKQLTATRYIYIYIIFVSFEYIGYSSMQHWQNSTNINCSFLVGYLFFYFFPSSSTNNRIICILHAYTIFILAAFERTLLILHNIPAPIFFFFFYISTVFAFLCCTFQYMQQCMENWADVANFFHCAHFWYIAIFVVFFFHSHFIWYNNFINKNPVHMHSRKMCYNVHFPCRYRWPFISFSRSHSLTHSPIRPLSYLKKNIDLIDGEYMR